MSKVLLHACCAVCVLYPVEKIISAGFEPIIYFCNPNIFPKEEYVRRLDELKRYCVEKNLKLYIEDVTHEDWLECIKGFEQEPERGLRCEKCFEYRLNKTANCALNLGINRISTTLTVSPHKNSKTIFSILEKVCNENDLKYLDYNFKKENGFLKTSQMADEKGFYRQTYCGCEFSIRG